MANEIFTRYTAGLNLYAVVFKGNQVWNGSSFGTPAAGSWASYAIALTEVQITGAASRYVADFPAIGATPAKCQIEIFLRAGGSPAVTDNPLTDPVDFSWDGAKEVGPHNASLSATGLDLVKVDGAKSVPGALQIVCAAVAGKITSAGTGVETFKGLDGTTDRLVVTVDASGNRTAVSYP